MMLGLTRLRGAAATVFAAALIVAAASLAASSAHAFTMENLSTGGNSTRFADPDERVKNFSQDSQPFGQNGPTVQFGGGQAAPYRPFAHGYTPPPPLINSGD